VILAKGTARQRFRAGLRVDEENSQVSAALSPDEVEAVIAAVDALPTAAKLADLITSCTPNG
jgi:hypothetical protein